MAARKAKSGLVTVYFAPYHSQPEAYLRGSVGRFQLIEQAISDGEWPYDNGDDPSFYAARHGGLLTWGVCRQDVRNAHAFTTGSIVVFFSYTKAIPSVITGERRDHSSQVVLIAIMFDNVLEMVDNDS